MKTITDRISYLPGSFPPMSGDVGIVRGDRFTWIYDVGNCIAAKDLINETAGPKNIILSHFHPDHVGNLSFVSYDALYLGKLTYSHIGRGEIISDDRYLEDGCLLHLFPIPSPHAKGCIGLEIDETYAFLGDATYNSRKQGVYCYNVQLLRDEIRALTALKANYLLLSHRDPFVREKDTVIAKLESILSQAKKDNAYIYCQ